MSCTQTTCKGCKRATGSWQLTGGTPPCSKGLSPGACTWRFLRGVCAGDPSQELLLFGEGLEEHDAMPRSLARHRPIRSDPGPMAPWAPWIRGSADPGAMALRVKPKQGAKKGERSPKADFRKKPKVTPGLRKIPEFPL